MGSEKLITYNLLVIGYWKYEKGTRAGSLSKYINSVHFCGWFIPSRQYTLPRCDDSYPAPPTRLWAPPPPHPHFLLASAGFCRWCVHEGMWDAGWGTVLFLLLSNVEPLWRQHPCVGCCRVAIISDGGARHGCLMLPDWVLLNYSNKVFTGLTHSPVSSIKSEGEWFVNGLHFMAQWVVKICDKVEVSEFK